MTDESLPARPRVRADVVVAELDGELAVFDPVSALVHEVDRIGALIWPFVDGSTTVDELVDDVAAAFDQPVEVVRPDIERFVRSLADRDLLEGSTVSRHHVEPERGTGYLTDPPSP